MADQEPSQGDDRKGKKQPSKFKRFEPTTRKFTTYVITTQDETELDSSNFQFVAVTDSQNVAGSNSTRKAVRSHVMRKFHKDKQAEASGKRKVRDLPQSSTTGSSTVAQDMQMPDAPISGGPMELPFRIPNQEDWYEPGAKDTRLAGISKALSAELSANYCPSLPGSILMVIEPVPPLVTRFPVPQDSMRHVHFTITMVNKYLVPMTPSAQSGWFTTVTSNIASFHATVLLSLTTQAQLRRIALPPECFYHSSEAVRHINNLLEDPALQCSDETINAIATLVMFESFVTQGTQRSVHLDGLETVLKMRREREGPSLDDALMDFVQCVDQHISASNHTPPRLSRTIPIPFTQSNHPFPPIPPKNYPSLTPQNTQIFTQIRQLSLTTSLLYAPTFDPSLQSAYTKGLLQIQHALSNAYDSIHEPVEKVWYHATVLYTFLVMRKIPFGSGVVVRMVRRLRGAAEAFFCEQVALGTRAGVSFIDTGEGEGGDRQVHSSLKGKGKENEKERCDQEIILWTTALGGAASVGNEEMQRYWKDLLIKMRQEMDLQTWEDARDVLRGWGWVEYICEPVGRVFWESCFEDGEGEGVVGGEDGGVGKRRGKGKEVVR